MFRLDPYSKLKKIEETTENMTKTIASLENDILETLKRKHGVEGRKSITP